MTLVVGIDGGGTHTRAGLYDGGVLLAETQAPCSNPVLLGVDASVDVLMGLLGNLLDASATPPSAIACGISGARRKPLRDSIAHAMAERTGAGRVIVTDDLRPVLFANAPGRPALLAIAGTGSSVVAQSAESQTGIIGGRGTLFGDYGSAYQLGVSALQSAADAEDGLAPETALNDALALAAGVGCFDELVLWGQTATKTDVAALARTVTRVAEAGDAVAARCIAGQAERLARQVLAAADRVGIPDDAPIYLNGGLAERCTRFRDGLAAALAKTRLTAAPALAPLRGHRAVIELAATDALPEGQPITVAAPRHGDSTGSPPPRETPPPTERAAQEKIPIDLLSAREIVERMNRADAAVAATVADERIPLADAVEKAARALMSGGRIVYIGAGTSGRLGVLDASECPPTFGVSPDRVVGIIAGGEQALRTSVEGAEDDRDAAVRDLAAVSPAVSAADVAVGIAASGTTPYVRAGLDYAKAQGAPTVLVCCNPACRGAADIVIAPSTGPEVLAGSTRLKAGTATKLVLNTLSTGAMALSGHVYEGMMVGMRPINTKLRARAAGMVTALTGASVEEAAALLERAGGDIRVAVVMGVQGVDADEARQRLTKADGRLRQAMQLGDLA